MKSRPDFSRPLLSLQSTRSPARFHRAGLRVFCLSLLLTERRASQKGVFIRGGLFEGDAPDQAVGVQFVERGTLIGLGLEFGAARRTKVEGRMIAHVIAAGGAGFDQGVHLVAAMYTVLHVAIIGCFLFAMGTRYDFVQVHFFDRWLFQGHGQAVWNGYVIALEGLEFLTDLAGLDCKILV